MVVKQEKHQLYYAIGIFMIVVLNSAFGILYVLTKVQELRLNLWLNLIMFVLCGINAVYLLIIACMMLKAVVTITRVSQRNSKDPNDRLIALHLVMIFFAFTGMCTMWSLFAAAWYMDYRRHDPNKYAGGDMRATGVLIGNVGSFLATLVLLYVFWGYGVSLEQQGIQK